MNQKWIIGLLKKANLFVDWNILHPGQVRRWKSPRWVLDRKYKKNWLSQVTIVEKQAIPGGFWPPVLNPLLTYYPLTLFKWWIDEEAETTMQKISSWDKNHECYLISEFCVNENKLQKLLQKSAKSLFFIIEHLKICRKKAMMKNKLVMKNTFKIIYSY